MERTLSFLFRKDSSSRSLNSGGETVEKKPVMRFAPPPSASDSYNLAAPRATGFGSPSKAARKSRGFGGILQKFSSSSSSPSPKKGARGFDMGIDPQQKLHEVEDVSHSIRLNLDVDKLKELGEQEQEGFSPRDAAKLEEQFGIKLTSASELVRLHTEAPSPSSAQHKGSEIDLTKKRPLREQIRLFFEKYEKKRLAKGGLDGLVAIAAQTGVETFNEQLRAQYGATLDDVADIDSSPPSPHAAPVSPPPISSSTASTSAPEIEENDMFGGPPPLPHRKETAKTNLPSMVEMRKDSLTSSPTTSRKGTDVDGAPMRKGTFNSETGTVPPSRKETHAKKGSAISEFDSIPVNTSISADSPEFKELKPRLVNFFVAHDPIQAAEGTLDHFVRQALTVGLAKFDDMLEARYEISLTEFERLKLIRKTMKACNNFQLDTTKAFGTCKCGFPKKDHEGGAAGAASPKNGTVQHILNSSSIAAFGKALSPGAATQERKVATRPSLNIATSNDAKIPASQMSPINRNATTGKIASPAVSGMRKRAPSKESVSAATGSTEPCSNYRLDMNGRTFGVCVCGFPRAEHKGR